MRRLCSRNHVRLLRCQRGGAERPHGCWRLLQLAAIQQALHYPARPLRKVALQQAGAYRRAARLACTHTQQAPMAAGKTHIAICRRACFS